MKRALIVLGVFALCGSLAVPAAAGEQGWHLRVFAAGIDPDLDETIVNGDGDDIHVTSGTDLGVGASLEYQFTDLLGIELGGFSGSPEVELSADVPGYGVFSVRDAMSTRVLTFDLNFHVTPNSTFFDVYLGAGLAYLWYGDLHYDDPEISEPLSFLTDNDLGLSAKANVAIALGKTSDWTAFGGLRYIWSNLEGTEAGDPNAGSESFNFNIFSFSVGIGYSF